MKRGRRLTDHQDGIVQIFDEVVTGDRLDPADARRDGAFLLDLEHTDLRTVVDMGTAAEFLAEIADLNDTHDIAVLLTEERHRAFLLCLIDRHLGAGHRDALEDDIIHALFYRQ